MLRNAHLAALTLTALTLGLSFAHVLEWPAKLGYDGELYTHLHTSLYAWWGVPGFGIVEPLAVLAAVGLAVAARRRPHARLLAVAAICLVIAFPVLFFWRVAPANAAFWAARAADTVPADWTAWRDRWEQGHAARFVLHLVAFVMLARAALAGGRT